MASNLQVGPCNTGPLEKPLSQLGIVPAPEVALLGGNPQGVFPCSLAVVADDVLHMVVLEGVVDIVGCLGSLPHTAWDGLNPDAPRSVFIALLTTVITKFASSALADLSSTSQTSFQVLIARWAVPFCQCACPAMGRM